MEPAANPTYEPVKLPRWHTAEWLKVSKDGYLVTANDELVERFLETLVATRAESQKLGGAVRPLWTYRADFGRIMATRPLYGLMRRAVMADTNEERRIAIWLLGKCGRKSDALLLYGTANTFPPTVRREVARALKRHQALRECESIATSDKDERSRRIADLQPRNFERILAKWHVPDEAAVRVPYRPFELYTHIDLRNPRRPKSREFIRRILYHIRRVLRGTA